jgi:hypothetical protein
MGSWKKVYLRQRPYTRNYERASDLECRVRKKSCLTPCAGVEFPARVNGPFRPHYVAWSEQQKIEFSALGYLRNVIRIVTETGLRKSARDLRTNRIRVSK